MGMGVSGKAATAPEGEYFRASVWGWRPLAEMLCSLFPELTSGCTYWQSNDGDGLDAQESVALANALDKAIKDKRIARYIEQRDTALAALADETCIHCHGTGKRNDVYVQGTCNACLGAGKRQPHDTWYRLDEETVKEFSAFLRHSGGFEIW